MGSLPLAQRLSYYANACQQRQALRGFDREPALAFGAMPAEHEVASIADLARMPPPPATAEPRAKQDGALGFAANERLPPSRHARQQPSPNAGEVPPAPSLAAQSSASRASSLPPLPVKSSLQPSLRDRLQQPFSLGACKSSSASDPVASGQAKSPLVSQLNPSASRVAASFSPAPVQEAADTVEHGPSNSEGRSGDGSRLLHWLDNERVHLRFAAPAAVHHHALERVMPALDDRVGLPQNPCDSASPADSATSRLVPDVRLSRLTHAVAGPATAVDLAKGLDNGRRGAYRLWRK